MSIIGVQQPMLPRGIFIMNNTTTTTTKTTKAGNAKAAGSKPRNKRRRRNRARDKLTANDKTALLDGSNVLQLRSSQTVNFMSAQEFKVTTGSTPGGIRVRGREMIAVVSNGASAAFAVTNYILGPPTFPRLSAYGGIYEEYFFNRANVIYQPSMGTQLSGAVSLWIDYDPGDVAEVSQILAAKNISYSISNVYAVNACEMLGPLCRLKRFLTTTNAFSNPLQVQQAQIRVATEGIPAPFAVTIGYLFVWYDVEFFAPA